MAQEKHALESGGSSSRNSQSRLGEDTGGDGGDDFLHHNSMGNHRDHSLHRDVKGDNNPGGGSKDGSGRSSGRPLSGE